MSVNIKIGKLVIKSDLQCYSIYKIVIRKEGKNKGDEFEKPIAHFPSLSLCLDAILERDLQNSDAIKIANLLSEVRELKRQIEEIKS